MSDTDPHLPVLPRVTTRELARDAAHRVELRATELRAATTREIDAVADEVGELASRVRRLDALLRRVFGGALALAAAVAAAVGGGVSVARDAVREAAVRDERLRNLEQRLQAADTRIDALYASRKD